MLRLLLTLKRIFPKLRWIDSALRSQWDAFWLKQWQEEQRVDPNTASMPPIVGSERAVFIETIASCWPFRSVLEVGCGFGQNAHILHEVLPGIRYVGVDLSSDRVQQASSLLQTIGKNNSMLIEGDVADLSGFPDNSTEVVICSGLLLYIPPAKLIKALAEMCRIAEKAVVILEQHDESASWDGREEIDLVRPAYWIRNYRSALDRAKSECAISLTAIESVAVASPRWTIEQWGAYAAVFKVSK